MAQHSQTGYHSFGPKQRVSRGSLLWMKFVVFSIFAALVSGGFIRQCPTSCPEECDFVTARQLVDSLISVTRLIGDNLDPIFCGCCESKRFASRRNSIYMSTNIAPISDQLRAVLGLPPAKSSLPAGEESEKLWVPFLPPCQPGTCSQRCAREVIAAALKNYNEIDMLLSKRCLCSNEECVARLEQIQAILTQLLSFANDLDSFTRPCLCPDP